MYNYIANTIWGKLPGLPSAGCINLGVSDATNRRQGTHANSTGKKKSHTENKNRKQTNPSFPLSIPRSLYNWQCLTWRRATMVSFFFLCWKTLRFFFSFFFFASCVLTVKWCFFFLCCYNTHTICRLLTCVSASLEGERLAQVLVKK